MKLKYPCKHTIIVMLPVNCDKSSETVTALTSDYAHKKNLATSTRPSHLGNAELQLGRPFKLASPAMPESSSKSS